MTKNDTPRIKPLPDDDASPYFEGELSKFGTGSIEERLADIEDTDDFDVDELLNWGL